RLPAPAVAAGGVVLARELPRRLESLGAPGDEEEPVQVAGRKGCDFRRQFDRARMCVGPVCVERQLTHLRCCGFPHLLAVAVADVDREKAGKGVHEALAVRVLEVAAVATDDDRHIAVPVTAHPREVEPEMVARSALKIQLLRCRGRQFASPTRVPQSYSCLTIWR